MDQREKSELIKIAIVVLLGLLGLLTSIFWLKGYKIKRYGTYTFYFKNVNGLEEGAALRWNGLKVGVVENLEPVFENFNLDPLPSNELIKLGQKHLKEAEKTLNSNGIKDFAKIREEIDKAQLEIFLGQASRMQTEVRRSEHIKVSVVVMTKDLPFGPVNQVSIVPSGLIGEQYVDITTIPLDKSLMTDFDTTKPRFVVLEPLRLDRVIRVNLESAEAIRNLTNRANALFKDSDAANMRRILDSLSDIAGDPQFQKNVKGSAKNVEELTRNFSIWKLLFR